jgi:ABC-type nitrate/sulfonate/bicarbonate transport system substrate-binding protein
MRTREFPVLSEEDEPLVARLSLGLGDDAARVLAYLLRRRAASTVDDDPADRLALRIGTGLNRTTLSDALDRLDRRDLVSTTTLETDQGRPPTAWLARDSVDATVDRTDAHHAATLFDQAITVAGELGTPPRVDDPGMPSAERPESASFTVGLNWFANVSHAPLFAARAGGSYDRWGLDVAIEEFAGSDRAIAAVSDGTVDVAVAGAATITRLRATGAPLVPLAPLYQRGMTVLYTTRDAFGGRLDGIESVRGRRVGMPVDAETGLLGRLFLSQSGVIDEVTVVDLSGEESDALSTGRADVVSGTFGDVRELEAAGHTVDVLAVNDHFPVYGPTFVTTDSVVDARPAALASFLAGTLAGWRTAVFDPAEAVRAVASADDPGGDETVADARAVAGLERTVDRFGTSAGVADHGWGWHETAGWQRLTTALGQVGLLTPGADG